MIWHCLLPHSFAVEGLPLLTLLSGSWVQVHAVVVHISTLCIAEKQRFSTSDMISLACFASDSGKLQQVQTKSFLTLQVAVGALLGVVTGYLLGLAWHGFGMPS